MWATSLSCECSWIKLNFSQWNSIKASSHPLALVIRYVVFLLFSCSRTDQCGMFGMGMQLKLVPVNSEKGLSAVWGDTAQCVKLALTWQQIHVSCQNRLFILLAEYFIWRFLHVPKVLMRLHPKHRSKKLRAFLFLLHIWIDMDVALVLRWMCCDMVLGH